MADPVHILVLGGAGQVGTELVRHAWPAGVSVHAPTRTERDITDEAAVAAMLDAQPYAAVINTAAYTAVDKAETDVAAAWRLNALAPAILAAETARRDIALVHVSTDYVFDGSSDRPYREDDPIAPLGVYGASKEGGEQAVRTSNRRHAILRTAWVVSPHRGNFVKTMLRLAAERDGLKIVDDQRGCPTSARDLAAALATVALRLATDEAAQTGTYHAVNSGETTWCGFARAILQGAAARGHRSVPVEGITTAQFPTPARRPANSRLDTSKLARDHGVQFPAWPDALGVILDELIGPQVPPREGVAS